jgi:antibiotic biosynthesis monooxygenase (ABM) superfamily enzyme
MMPFGIQIRGFIVGLLMAYFVIPWIQRLILTRTAKAPS